MLEMLDMGEIFIMSTFQVELRVTKKRAFWGPERSSSLSSVYQLLFRPVAEVPYVIVLTLPTAHVPWSGR